MPADYLQGRCNTILNTIRSSSLNYAVQETPFSLYVTIRKSEVKFKSSSEEKLVTEPHVSYNPNFVSPEAFTRVKQDLEDSLEDIEAKNNYILKLEDALKNFDEKLSNVEGLERQLKETHKENLTLKQQNILLSNQVAEASEEVNKSKSKVDNLHIEKMKLQNSVDHLDSKRSVLDIQNKVLKEEMKCLEKETEETIAELQKKIDTIENELEIFTCRKVEASESQTEPHPEIPYNVTDQLPPIFGSQLCYHSRPIHLSSSLPSLDSICWTKPSEDFSEEAEEALAEQYDREIREFYLDERKRVQATRGQLFEEPDPGIHLNQE